MSFLKKFTRGVNHAVKFVDHSMHKLEGGIGSAGKIIREGHDMYRSQKHKLLEKVPALAGVVRAIEHSPLGVAIDGARGTVESGISDLGFAAKSAHHAFNGALAAGGAAAKQGIAAAHHAEGAFNSMKRSANSVAGAARKQQTPPKLIADFIYN